MRTIIYNTEEAYGLAEGQIYAGNLDIIPHLHEQFVLYGQSDRIAIVQSVRWIFDPQWNAIYCEVYVTFLK